MKGEGLGEDFLTLREGVSRLGFISRSLPVEALKCPGC